VDERFAGGAREERASGAKADGDTRHDSQGASVPLRLQPPRRGHDEGEDMPNLSPEPPEDGDMDMDRTPQRDAGDMEDNGSGYEPSEPAAKEGKNEDTHMGLLEADAPVA